MNTKVFGGHAQPGYGPVLVPKRHVRTRMQGVVPERAEGWFLSLPKDCGGWGRKIPGSPIIF